MFTLLQDQLVSRGPLTVAHYSVFVSFYFVWVHSEKGLCSTSHIHGRRRESISLKA